MKTERIKVLLDIYYNPDAMMKWKESCLATQQNIKNKAEKFESILKIIKKKIKEERNNISNEMNP